MTTLYFANSGWKDSSVPLGAVVATSTVKRPVSSRYFFIILVVVGQTPWLFWPSTIRAFSGSAEATAVRLRTASKESAHLRIMAAPNRGEEWRRIDLSLLAKHL